MDNLLNSFINIRNASSVLSTSKDEERKKALLEVAKLLNENKEIIFQENEKDLKNAKDSGINDAILHRLKFSEEKLKSVTEGLIQLSNLADPVGKICEKRELDKALILEKKTFPLGVIGMIFEARPDALVQIAGLALRSANAVILKGGKEAQLTNRILITLIKKATLDFSFSDSWILGLESHEDVNVLLKADKYVDLLIPRGSNAFVRYVIENSKIPVMGHADGICTTYIDSSADLEKAIKVCVDAKTQYVSACNTTETFLVHKDIKQSFLPKLNDALRAKNVIIHADFQALPYMKGALIATEDVFYTEFLNLECAVKVVSNVQEAVEHIQKHGSHHTDAILTEDEINADYFVSKVDSADVFVNCSTRFADGFRFGLGAEVGISTSKLHARGPVGLDGLMTTKWILRGNGQTVAEYSGENAKHFTHRELM